MQLTSLFALVIGYLLGSLSPSYILGKLIKGIDIREHGDRNAGTVNTYRVLGFFPSVVTATIDLSKGIAAMVIARSLGAAEAFAYASGLAAIVGHIFPFYLKFRGGQGVATATGLLLTSLAILLKNGWFPWTSLPVLVGVVLAFTYVARKGEVVGAIVLPLLLFSVYSTAPLNMLTIFFGVIVIHIIIINVLNIVKQGVFRLKTRTRETIKWTRFFLRPFAISFLILYSSYDKQTVLIVVGAIALFFIVTDAVRLVHSRVNVFLFKTLAMVFKGRETRRFSSITMFLVACFVTILLFDKDIATIAITFLIFGDMFGKFFGLQYGRVKIFNKSLEGSIAFLVACAIAAYILAYYIVAPVNIFFIGAIVATVTELAPLGVDDNFTVSLISASAMYVITVF